MDRNAIMAKILDPDIVERGSVAPIGKRADGSTTFAVPQIVPDILNSLLLTGDVAQGNQYTMGDVTDLAMTVGGMGMTGASFGGVPAGSLGAFGGKAGPYIPDIPPKGLRDRYWSLLHTASGGKDPARIKITPERAALAKELLKKQINTRNEFIPRIDTLGTEQSRKAAAFASETIRAGHDPRIKFPDGPLGSVYVRAGDKGSVRFSNHPAPIDPATGEMVGGYSKTMKRRHYPADVSVSPGDWSYDDALRWLNSGGS